MFNIDRIFSPFIKLLEKLANKYEYATILDDYCVLTIHYFSNSTFLMENATNIQKRYKEDELQIFNEMIKTMTATYHDAFVTRNLKWFDFFGDIYMYLASKSRQSRLGQFFTPEAVTDLCVLMQYSDDLTGAGVKISDPACGSGRFLLAFQGNYPGNYTFGEDLDPLCAKMTAINMMFHGCEGEVVCHDTLQMDYNFGFKINPNIRLTGLPCIGELLENEAFVMQKNTKQESVFAAEKVDVPQRSKVVTINKSTEQFDLFKSA